ncbi:group II intron reverse transcriptase/maturase [Sorangium sp. So ce861]|uniref:group II intron reverse transcriptase/maturase n=2 Tax=Sorangium sp. So ce861 TaxID=3133323 RepID=UPI003F5F8E91
MAGASTSGAMSPGLLKVAERARQEPKGVFHSLAHLIDVSALERAYGRLRKDAAVGVDGMTKEQYGQELGRRLNDLHDRMASKRYRHQPIRRVHIPKGQGKTRPIGVSALEDKIVQGAVREVLESIYEQDFLDCSYGFRPGRRAHDALRALNWAVYHGEVSWIVEADIRSFFDSVDREALMEMLSLRVVDGALLRLVGKCLHVGVLDGEEVSTPDVGTAQGSVLSPLLGNVYLHHVLDLWFEREVKPRLRGKALLVRYADDFVIGFEHRDDAERVMAVLGKRMGRYGLTLHPEKTRLVDFRRPTSGQTRGKGPSTIDFLGFTLYWRKTLRGRWEMWCKTQRARLRRALVAVEDFCRRHRHEPIKVQHAALVQRMNGHLNYFGVNGNQRSMRLLLRAVNRCWRKWLNRRSQNARMTWKKYTRLRRELPFPSLQVRVQIWC